MVGLIQVIVYDPVRLLIVKVTGGGAGRIFNVSVTLHPKGSTTLTVVIPIGNPCAVSEFPDKDPGTGLHVIVDPTEAEPAQVN